MNPIEIGYVRVVPTADHEMTGDERGPHDALSPPSRFGDLEIADDIDFQQRESSA